jgi:hypothetical protein
VLRIWSLLIVDGFSEIWPRSNVIFNLIIGRHVDAGHLRDRQAPAAHAQTLSVFSGTRSCAIAVRRKNPDWTQPDARAPS